MKWYREWLFPRALDWVMHHPSFPPLRQELVEGLEGRVLEIGFGTGLNLPYYPPSLGSLEVLEPISTMEAQAAGRIEKSPLVVKFYQGEAENLPFEAGSFDAVISSWTMCSIQNLDQALAEIRRVLNVSGEFRFVEHGRSPSPHLARWQDLLTPMNRVVTLGCHLNRDFFKILEKAGFELGHREVNIIPGIPRLLASTYQGNARPKD